MRAEVWRTRARQNGKEEKSTGDIITLIFKGQKVNEAVCVTFQRRRRDGKADIFCLILNYKAEVQ